MNRLSGIKAVSFDADGTLCNFKEVMRRSLSHTLKELADTNPKAARKLDVKKMIAIRDRVAARASSFMSETLLRTMYGAPSTPASGVFGSTGEGWKTTPISHQSTRYHPCRNYWIFSELK